MDDVARCQIAADEFVAGDAGIKNLLPAQVDARGVGPLEQVGNIRALHAGEENEGRPQVLVVCHHLAIGMLDDFDMQVVFLFYKRLHRAGNVNLAIHMLVEPDDVSSAHARSHTSR